MYDNKDTNCYAFFFEKGGFQDKYYVQKFEKIVIVN